MPSSFHSELARPAFDAIEASGLSPDQKARSGQLIVEATFNLDAARLGRTLYTLNRHSDGSIRSLLDDSGWTIEFASEQLVSRCLATALDLCASALHWLVSPTPPYAKSPDREADVATWRSDEVRATLQRDLRYAPLGRWLGDLLGDERCGVLFTWRHGVTHRWLRRDRTVAVGASDAPHPTRVVLRDRSYSLPDLIETLTPFANDRFVGFVRAVRDSFP